MSAIGRPAALECRRFLVQFLAGMDSSQIRIILHLMFTSVFCTVHIGLCNFYVFLPECSYSLAIFISVTVEITFFILDSIFLWLLILQNNYRSC